MAVQLGPQHMIRREPCLVCYLMVLVCCQHDLATVPLMGSKFSTHAAESCEWSSQPAQQYPCVRFRMPAVAYYGVARARTGMSTPVCLTTPAVFSVVQEMLHLAQYQESDTG